MCKTLGVIGGLGPLATAYFYELLTKMTKAERDQDHIEILIHSVPMIPDRTAFILGKSSESPLPLLIKTGNGLVESGADLIAVPCITAHYFYKELNASIPVPILNLPYETALHIKKMGLKKAGIMATDGTVESELFQTELKKEGLIPVLPGKHGQSLVMHLIYENVKPGKPVETDKFSSVVKELRELGAEIIILGCTELSLIKRDYRIGEGFLDAMEVLAMKSVLSCGKKLSLR